MISVLFYLLQTLVAYIMDALLVPVLDSTVNGIYQLTRVGQW